MAKRSEKYSLAAVNARLKAAQARVSLKVRGKYLYMMATLPPRPDDARLRPYQQEISTGQANTAIGCQNAEGMARELGGRIAVWRAARKNPQFFDWSHYETARSKSAVTVGQFVEQFERHYRETHSITDATWINQWHKVFKHLPQGKLPTAEMMVELALSKSRNSRTRMQFCRKLQHLANYAGVEVDLLQYKGNYGPSKVAPRELPTDEAIAYWREQIPHKGWRWIYGALAAGALRPHEAFFSTWDAETFKVLKGKTGPRDLQPDEFFYPEWVDDWDLRSQVLPKVDAEKAYKKSELGNRITRQLRRYGVPFTSYDLRHAAAIRMTVAFRVPETVSARLMGHTPEEHMRTYHKWISQARSRQAIERALNASDRPKPPSLA